MSYTLYDFTESLSCARRDGADLQNDQLVRCVAAHGEQGDCAEWSGGFLVELKDGRFAYISGWCDTTGWGCQDGANVEFFAELPALKSLASAWDMDPADLNKWIADGAKERD